MSDAGIDNIKQVVILKSTWATIRNPLDKKNVTPFKGYKVRMSCFVVKRIFLKSFPIYRPNDKPCRRIIAHGRVHPHRLVNATFYTGENNLRTAHTTPRIM